MTSVAERVLRVLQAAPGGWLDRDSLIEQADIWLPDDDLDTKINAVAATLDELAAAGYETEMQREEAGDFYRLA